MVWGTSSTCLPRMLGEECYPWLCSTRAESQQQPRAPAHALPCKSSREGCRSKTDKPCFWGPLILHCPQQHLGKHQT